MAKSFSIKLGADTTEFLKEMRKVDKQINSTQKTAEELEKSLDFEFDARRAEQAQKQFQKALEMTEEKAQRLKEQMTRLEESGRIDSEDYRRLELELAKTEAQAVKLRQSLEEVKNIKIEQLADKFKSIGNDIESAGKKVASFSAAAAGAIAGAVKLAKDSVAAGDEIATLADKYDMSTKAIQRWSYVAMQTDVEMDTLLKAMQKAQSAFAEQAAGGTNAAVKALEALGLSFKDFGSGEEAFEALITRLSAVDDRTLQVAYATDILGDRFAASLIPMLKAGKDAIIQYTEEFEEVGYLSDETINYLAALDNEVNKVTAQFQLAKTELGIAMIPVYEKLVDILQNYVIPAVKDLSEWFNNLSPASQNVIIGLAGIIAVAGPLVILLGKVLSGIGEIVKVLPTLSKALNALNTPLGRTMVAVTAIVTAVKLITDIVDSWGSMNALQKVISVLGTLTVVALGAAIAMGAFHSAWSLGLAVAGIVAGIAAVTAAVNSAKKDIEGVADFSAPSVIGGSVMSEQELANASAWINEANKSAGSTNNQTTNNYTEDNSSLTVNVYVTEPAASAEEIAEIVSRKIATLAQARK